MDFRLLGPLEVLADGRALQMGEGRQRALLAVLLLRANHVVPSERLVEELWDGNPTPTAPKMLQKYVWQLRTALGDREPGVDQQRLLTRGAGYLLRVGPDELDADRFERLLREGREARAAGQRSASDTLRAALAEWRGSALESFGDASFARAAVARLEELRLGALEERIAADLDLGRHADLVGELEELVALQPLRERLRGQLMLALYRSDRQAEALHVYRETHRMFGEEMGLEPSVELQRLERAILEHDPSLDWRSSSPAPSPIRPAPGAPPYRGLEHFDVDDADWFFGRERATARLADRIRGARLVAVVGASGSGKSSLVRAGLVATLARDAGSPTRAYVLTPTSRPLEALALALGGVDESLRTTAALIDDLMAEPRTLHLAVQRLIAGKGRGAASPTVLVVDQFEELFTMCRDEAERAAFVANLMTAVHSEGPVRVVIALRADFYAHLAAYEALRSAVARDQDYIGPMTSEELRAAITGPAARGLWSLEPGLVEVILQDLEGAPGALPLLSHALLETWHRRRGRELTVEGYADAGGVRKAIARTADRLFRDELDAGEREIGRQILLRLTELGEGTADTRRRVALRELIPDAPTDAAIVATRVLGRLADARLVTTGEDSVEVAHEALIREWPTLHRWLAEDRDGLRTHRQITEAADEWEAMDRDPGGLFRGTRLSRVLEWTASHAGELNDRERAFVAASDTLHVQEEADRVDRLRRDLEAAQRVADAERRRAEHETAVAGRLRTRAMALAGALALAAVLGGAAVIFGQQARDALASAESQRLGAEANGILQRGESAELAALLALRGMDAQYTQQADAALQRASHQQYSDRIITMPRRVDGLAVSADGRVLLAGTGDGDTHLVNLDDGQVIRTLAGTTDYVPDVDLSPDGLLAATVDESIHLWDTTTGVERWSVPAQAQDVAFMPDGRELVAIVDDAATRLDVGDGSVSWRAPVEPRSNLFLSPDGTTALVTTGAGAALLDMTTGATGQQLTGHTGPIAHASFSPDGRLVATSSRDRTARIWDVATGEAMQVLEGHTDIVFQAAFSPDGTTLATGSLDTTARLWDVGTGASLRRFAGHTASVYSVAFTPDGLHAVTTGADGTIRFWAVEAPPERDTLAGPTSFMYALEYSPDGRLLFAGNADGTAQLWDLQTQEVVHVLLDDARVNVAAFSPDGRHLLTAAEGRPAELWDTSTGELVAALEGSGGAEAAAFSHDGSRMLASAGDGRIGTWDPATLRLLQTVEPEVPSGGTLSPDGTRILTFRDIAGAPNTEVWDAVTGYFIRSFEHPGGVLDARFAPDGRTILVVGRDNVARLWDAATGAMVRELRGHTNIMWRAAFAPDGRHAFTTSQDKSMRMWDVATGRQERYFPGHGLSAVAGVAVSPDGEQLAIGSYDGFVQLVPSDIEALRQSVCDRLRRDLDASERAIYGVAEEGATCP